MIMQNIYNVSHNLLPDFVTWISDLNFWPEVQIALSYHDPYLYEFIICIKDQLSHNRTGLQIIKFYQISF